MLQLYKIIASVCGIGYIPKGSGTFGALFACLLIITIQQNLILSVQYYYILLLVLSIIFTFIGRYAAKKVEPLWGEDASKIVIDEVVGMWLTLCFVPYSLTAIGIGFVLFRFFDIYKPLNIRNFEKYANGWGVMLDDVMAGIWSNLVLQLILLFL